MIYFDNSATTQMDLNSIEVYKKYAVDCFYNPSAMYSKAVESQNLLKKAKQSLLKALGASNGNIIFTASGTESDNIAMFSALKRKKGKIIISQMEHSAVYYCAKELSARGYDLVLAQCDKHGRVDIDNLSKILDDDVVLVSIIHVSNETGAINDLTTISKLIKQKCPNAIFHSDGVQAFGKIPFNISDLGVDLYSISAHKLHGPKGLGALWTSNKINLKTFIFGGGQENNIRSATENIPAIMAFESLLDNFGSSTTSRYKYLKELQSWTVGSLEKRFDNIIINTNISQSAPQIISCSFDCAMGEVIVRSLEQKGIIIGTGSACSSNKASSRIAEALSISGKYAHGMIRISFSQNNTKEQVQELIKQLEIVVDNLKNYQKI